MPSLSDKHPNPAVDNFITALADKHSPFNKHVPVNFKQVADKAKTIEREGELSYLALGSTGSEERKECRRLYDKYRKRAEQKNKDRYVPFDFDYWSFLLKEDKLVAALYPSSSSSSSVSPVRRRVSPKRQHTPPPTQNNSTSTTPPITKPITTAIMSLKEESHATYYERLMQDRNSVPVDFHNSTNNFRHIAWDQFKVAILPAGYSTRGSLAVPIHHACLIKYAKPQIVLGGYAIDIFEASHDPLLQESDLLESSLDEHLPATGSAGRKTAVDVVMGNKGGGAELHDVTIGEKTIYDVPFIRRRYVFPDGVCASNKHFNGSNLVTDSELTAKLMYITDFKEKNPKDILKELKTPTDAEVGSAMGDAAKAKLWDDPAQKFLEYQMDVNSAVFLVVEFALLGEADTGNKGGSTPSVTNLFGKFSVSG